MGFGIRITSFWALIYLSMHKCMCITQAWNQSVTTPKCYVIKHWRSEQLGEKQNCLHRVFIAYLISISDWNFICSKLKDKKNTDLRYSVYANEFGSELHLNISNRGYPSSLWSQSGWREEPAEATSELAFFAILKQVTNCPLNPFVQKEHRKLDNKQTGKTCFRRRRMWSPIHRTWRCASTLLNWCSLHSRETIQMLCRTADHHKPRNCNSYFKGKLYATGCMVETVQLSPINWKYAQRIC